MDTAAIRELQFGYADVVSRRAWDELDRLLLADATIEVDTVTSPKRTFTGPAEFADFVRTATDRFDHFQFVVLNAVVEADGDTGRSRMFMCEIRHHRDAGSVDGDDGWSTAYGVYHDRYRKLDGRWWFAERRYRSLARTAPQTELFGLPAGLGPIGR